MELVAERARKAGIRRVLVRGPAPDSSALKGFSLVRVSDDSGGEDTVAWVKVAGGSDIENAVRASSQDHAFVVVECSDWKVIPLENMIAEFRRRGRKLYAFVEKASELGLFFSILERGVDGVVLPARSLAEAESILSAQPAGRASISPAKIIRIVDVGLGDRACVDTVSQLSVGEGMLIGNKASFFFLVHGETIPSQYIPTRPFRVNAGALHSYALGGGGKTNYLSEIESGQRVLVVDRHGASREVAVGRVKIERRPLLMIEAVAGEERGAAVLQNAETIRLVRADGRPVSVTELKQGDEVLVHVSETKGRHFGGEVDEFIIEK